MDMHLALDRSISSHRDEPIPSGLPNLYVVYLPWPDAITGDRAGS